MWNDLFPRLSNKESVFLHPPQHGRKEGDVSSHQVQSERGGYDLLHLSGRARHEGLKRGNGPIAWDGSGNAYVNGSRPKSSKFPGSSQFTSNAVQRDVQPKAQVCDGWRDAFVFQDPAPEAQPWCIHFPWVARGRDNVVRITGIKHQSRTVLGGTPTSTGRTRVVSDRTFTSRPGRLQTTCWTRVNGCIEAFITPKRKRWQATTIHTTSPAPKPSCSWAGGGVGYYGTTVTYPHPRLFL